MARRQLIDQGFVRAMDPTLKGTVAAAQAYLTQKNRDGWELQFVGVGYAIFVEVDPPERPQVPRVLQEVNSGDTAPT